MKIDSNQICTKDNEIVEGEIYQYKESMPNSIFDFKVLKIIETDDWWGFDVEIVNTKEKTNFGFAKGRYAYGGMFRFYDRGTYQTKLL